MKELCVVIAIILILSLCGMAQAEGCNNFAASIIKTDVIGHTEVEELQEKASAIFGNGMDISINLIETKAVSAGEAKYTNGFKVAERSWFQKTLDWITFWN